MMPLPYADKDRPVKVLKVTGNDRIRAHLADLGFMDDATITVKQEIAGNLIVEVKGTRMALDASMARRIMVKESAI